MAVPSPLPGRPSCPGIVNVSAGRSPDAMRRAIESLPRAEYFALGYYERWVRAIRQLVIEKGLLTEDELDRKLAALQTQARAS